MSDITRWSIAELLARYELEPCLDDLFVEGMLDREILSESPSRARTGATIYEVDCVDVSAETLAKYGFTTGNKQRVIALAMELAATPAHAKVRCLADRDMDHWLGSLFIQPRLRWTSFCSIESHFLVEKCIQDILLTTGRAKIKSIDAFIASLHVILRNLYALRLVDKELGLALSWPSLRKYLARESDSIVLNINGYTTAILLSNGKNKRRREVDAKVAQWLAKLNCDIRLAARGHDFTVLLAWAMSEFHGLREFASPQAIERLFVLLARSIETLSGELQ